MLPALENRGTQLTDRGFLDLAGLVIFENLQLHVVNPLVLKEWDALTCSLILDVSSVPLDRA